MAHLVLSLFPGADLFGMAFENEGFCVVKGPDTLLGGDIKKFKGLPYIFDGIIGGPPCQSFSKAGISHIGYGSTQENLVPEFERIVKECGPMWWIMEEVPQAPTPTDATWSEVLNAWDYGSPQKRRRRFSSNIDDLGDFIHSFKCSDNDKYLDPYPTVLATEYKASAGSDNRRRAARKVGRKLTLKEINWLMGLPDDFETPCLLNKYSYIVRGNGVPLQMGTAIARAIRYKYDIR